VRLYRLGAAQGYAPAQASLAHAYVLGLGVERSIPQARMWAQLAADQGHRDGQVTLAAIYLDCDRDELNARIWYERAAAQGSIAALAKLFGFA
jgi:TPR repeat protein